MSYRLKGLNSLSQYFYSTLRQKKKILLVRTLVQGIVLFQFISTSLRCTSTRPVVTVDLESTFGRTGGLSLHSFGSCLRSGSEVWWGRLRTPFLLGGDRLHGFDVQVLLLFTTTTKVSNSKYHQKFRWFLLILVNETGYFFTYFHYTVKVHLSQVAVINLYLRSKRRNHVVNPFFTQHPTREEVGLWDSLS